MNNGNSTNKYHKKENDLMVIIYKVFIINHSFSNLMYFTYLFIYFFCVCEIKFYCTQFKSNVNRMLNRMHNT